MDKNSWTHSTIYSVEIYLCDDFSRAGTHEGEELVQADLTVAVSVAQVHHGVQLDIGVGVPGA